MLYIYALFHFFMQNGSGIIIYWTVEMLNRKMDIAQSHKQLREAICANFTHILMLPHWHNHVISCVSVK